MGGGPGVGPQTFQLATTAGAHHPHIIGTTTINGQTIQIAAAPHQQQQIQQGQGQQQQQTMMVPTSGGGVQQVHFTTTAQQPQQQTTQQQTQQTPQQQQQQQAQIQAQIQAQVQQQIQAQLQQQAQQQQQQQIVKPQTANQAVQVKPVEPLFSAPPAPKRLVHTHTYMKYIESLKPDRRYLSNWERQLSASPATCSFNAALLANGKVNGAKKSTPGTASSSSATSSSSSANPVTWLENGANGHSSVVDALWTLRDFMMKDALSLATI
ncbi:PREDICTED: nuclear transcription factor Y subunit beta-like [Rhagoletis zephyria]|uniref:nuclear transcription factor Y subunit beta-like n=1 Tax=Rhagoletis zephyria TaxID=28612 RepID=UPI00081145BA|nr:PREDICTED: nuclear transcription factor Y subunit beta-like [Rhagoletis zephyria]